jgi:hypothetical protein
MCGIEHQQQGIVEGNHKYHTGSSAFEVGALILIMLTSDPSLLSSDAGGVCCWVAMAFTSVLTVCVVSSARDVSMAPAIT